MIEQILLVHKETNKTYSNYGTPAGAQNKPNPPSTWSASKAKRMNTDDFAHNSKDITDEEYKAAHAAAMALNMMVGQRVYISFTGDNKRHERIFVSMLTKNQSSKFMPKNGETPDKYIAMVEVWDPKNDFFMRFPPSQISKLNVITA